MGSLLSSFEPKDWVTIAIAVAALAVSIFALAQKARYHPKPVWVDRSVRDPDGWWRLNVENEGDGHAYDVKLTAVDRASQVARELIDLDKIPNGESAFCRFHFTDREFTAVRFVLAWRQSPNMQRIRKKVLRVPTRRMRAGSTTPTSDLQVIHDLGIY